MAVNRNNVVVEGASGKFGRNLVFRQRKQVTVMAAVPTINPDRVYTDKQIAQRFRFMEASMYGVGAIADPELKAAYLAKAKGNQTAYNMAFKDFLTSPVLHQVDWSRYNGEVGDTLVCRITDILAVVSVKVSLYDADGVLVEEGLAVQSALKLDWVYTATVAHTPVVGTMVVVQMTDTPQNVYREEVVIG
ncbi:hypothetical protein [Pedobacter sp. ASV28]|uniref:hypothetical protein n=1 Tax=Pedobacter sp. ASV28 TaxID=2795123 RepID=UPI0018EAAB65|nr:hypothetical protein [Pedobacter sp. ASV28]